MRSIIVSFALTALLAPSSAKAADEKESPQVSYVKECLRQLKDKNPYVRIAGSFAIGSARFDVRPFAAEVLPELIKALDDIEDTVRRNAAWSIERFGSAAKAAIPKLTALTEDPMLSVRVNAMNTLGVIGPEAKPAIPALLNVLKNDKEADARQHAARALAHMGKEAESALPDLLEATQDTAVSVRIACMTAIVYMGVFSADAQSAVLNRFKDESAEVRRLAIDAALALKVEPKILITSLRTPFCDADHRVRELASNAMKNQGKAALPVLAEMLEHKEAGVRTNALWGIGFLGSEAVEASEKVIRLLKNDTSATIRARAAAALGAIGEPNDLIVPALKNALQDNDKLVRLRAQEALDLIEATKKPPEKKE